MIVYEPDSIVYATAWNTPVGSRLTSAKNPLIKEIRRAIAHGGLTNGGYCVAEGPHLLDEAIRSGVEIRAVIAADSARLESAGVEAIRVPDELLAQISSTETPQGIIALIKPPSWSMDHLFGQLPLIVILDGIQDPGNAGAIVRAAEAFGATGIVFLKGSVCAHNPKSIRGSAGSIFRLPIQTAVDAHACIELLRSRGLDIYAAMPNASATIGDLRLRRPCAFIIGSEGAGIGETLQPAATPVRIPVHRVESLNAAMSAGILLYEASRQRSHG